MRGSKKAGPVKRRVMRGGGMAKKAGPVKKKAMRSGGRSSADMAGRQGATLSQAQMGRMAARQPSNNLLAGMTPVSRKKGGKTNLRDEEARVIGVQDNAADEMRRVKARRPKDAAERRDKKDQLARVGSRERNARDEMDRLRDEAGNMGMKKGGRSKADNSRTKMSHVAKKRDKNIGRTEAEIALPRAKNRVDEPPRKLDMKGVAEGDASTAMKRGGRSKKDAEKAQSKGTGNFDKYVRSRGWMREGNRPGSTSSGLKTGGKAVKKMATGRQTTAETRGAVPRSRATSPSTQRQGNMLINQHKRMAMGEDVLTGKMIKKKRGGRTASDSAKSKAAHSKSSHKYFAGASQNPKRVGRTIKKAGGKVANTAVRLNMGAPKVRTVKARGMGAAIKGGSYLEC